MFTKKMKCKKIVWQDFGSVLVRRCFGKFITKPLD
uniref:Uncharacterized protein n=1 Tax=Arundo donax TaxID=35708 RepID=A0A0A9CCY8_ARUDO